MFSALSRSDMLDLSDVILDSLGEDYFIFRLDVENERLILRRLILEWNRLRL